MMYLSLEDLDQLESDEGRSEAEARRVKEENLKRRERNAKRRRKSAQRKQRTAVKAEVDIDPDSAATTNGGSSAGGVAAAVVATTADEGGGAQRKQRTAVKAEVDIDPDSAATTNGGSSAGGVAAAVGGVAAAVVATTADDGGGAERKQRTAVKAEVDIGPDSAATTNGGSSAGGVAAAVAATTADEGGGVCSVEVRPGNDSAAVANGTGGTSLLLASLLHLPAVAVAGTLSLGSTLTRVLTAPLRRANVVDPLQPGFDQDNQTGVWQSKPQRTPRPSPTGTERRNKWQKDPDKPLADVSMPQRPKEADGAEVTESAGSESTRMDARGAAQEIQPAEDAEVAESAVSDSTRVDARGAQQKQTAKTKLGTEAKGDPKPRSRPECFLPAPGTKPRQMVAPDVPPPDVRQPAGTKTGTKAVTAAQVAPDKVPDSEQRPGEAPVPEKRDLAVSDAPDNVLEAEQRPCKVEGEEKKDPSRKKGEKMVTAAVPDAKGTEKKDPSTKRIRKTAEACVLWDLPKRKKRRKSMGQPRQGDTEKAAVVGAPDIAVGAGKDCGREDSANAGATAPPVGVAPVSVTPADPTLPPQPGQGATENAAADIECESAKSAAVGAGKNPQLAPQPRQGATEKAAAVGAADIECESTKSAAVGAGKDCGREDSASAGATAPPVGVTPVSVTLEVLPASVLSGSGAPSCRAVAPAAGNPTEGTKESNSFAAFAQHDFCFCLTALGVFWPAQRFENILCADTLCHQETFKIRIKERVAAAKQMVDDGETLLPIYKLCGFDDGYYLADKGGREWGTRPFTIDNLLRFQSQIKLFGGENAHLAKHFERSIQQAWTIHEAATETLPNRVGGPTVLTIAKDEPWHSVFNKMFYLGWNVCEFQGDYLYTAPGAASTVGYEGTHYFTSTEAVQTHVQTYNPYWKPLAVQVGMPAGLWESARSALENEEDIYDPPSPYMGDRSGAVVNDGAAERRLLTSPHGLSAEETKGNNDLAAAPEPDGEQQTSTQPSATDTPTQDRLNGPFPDAAGRNAQTCAPLRRNLFPTENPVESPVARTPRCDPAALVAAAGRPEVTTSDDGCVLFSGSHFHTPSARIAPKLEPLVAHSPVISSVNPVARSTPGDGLQSRPRFRPFRDRGEFTSFFTNRITIARELLVLYVRISVTAMAILLLPHYHLASQVDDEDVMEHFGTSFDDTDFFLDEITDTVCPNTDTVVSVAAALALDLAASGKRKDVATTIWETIRARVNTANKAAKNLNKLFLSPLVKALASANQFAKYFYGRLTADGGQTNGELTIAGLRLVFAMLETHIDMETISCFLDLGSNYNWVPLYYAQYFGQKAFGIEYYAQRAFLAALVYLMAVDDGNLLEERVGYIVGDLENIFHYGLAELVYVFDIVFTDEVLYAIIAAIGNTKSVKYVVSFKGWKDRNVDILFLAVGFVRIADVAVPMQTSNETKHAILYERLVSPNEEQKQAQQEAKESMEILFKDLFDRNGAGEADRMLNRSEEDLKTAEEDMVRECSGFFVVDQEARKDKYKNIKDAMLEQMAEGSRNRSESGANQAFRKARAAEQSLCLCSVNVECESECKFCADAFSERAHLVEKRASSIEGTGLFAKETISGDTHLLAYTGKQTKSVPKNAKYTAKLGEKDIYIDARLSLGLHRFFNSSCKPNCVLSVVWKQDGGERLGVFSSCAVIKEGEELTLDYDMKGCNCPVCVNRR